MDVLAALRSSSRLTAVFADFDGTLAQIVADPEEARPLPGVPELLTDLASSCGVVAVVSGRPLAFLRRHLPGSAELYGLYGLESLVDGRPWQHPDGLAWRKAVDDVATAAREAGPEGVDIEHKGMSLTLHFRQHSDAAGPALAWASAAATRSGLRLRKAKMSLELHPPVDVDKGTVVESRSAGMTGACYVGDDVGDLSAFAALDRLASHGVTTLKAAVRTSETDDALLAQADVEVDGPEGAVALLRGLVAPR